MKTSHELLISTAAAAAIGFPVFGYIDSTNSTRQDQVQAQLWEAEQSLHATEKQVHVLPVNLRPYQDEFYDMDTGEFILKTRQNFDSEHAHDLDGFRRKSTEHLIESTPAFAGPAGMTFWALRKFSRRRKKDEQVREFIPTEDLADSSASSKSLSNRVNSAAITIVAISQSYGGRVTSLLLPPEITFDKAIDDEANKKQLAAAWRALCTRRFEELYPEDKSSPEPTSLL